MLGVFMLLFSLPGHNPPSHDIDSLESGLCSNVLSSQKPSLPCLSKEALSLFTAALVAIAKTRKQHG